MIPRVRDICCGMGGNSLGYINAGFQIDLGVDIWPVALKTYGGYLDAPTKEQDINDYFPTKNDYDVIVVGGTPCQDFSLVNTKRNIYSKRAQLLLDFCRIVKAMQPEAFVYENVIHLAKWGEAAILEMPGYKVTKNIVDTSLYGVPQKRRRKIFVGSKRKYLQLSPPPGIVPSTVRDAFTSIPENWGFTKHRPETIEKFSKVNSSTWVSKEPTSDYQGTIRLSWDKPSCGVTNVKKAQILHPTEHRIISLAEALALQGFPHWYIPEGTGVQQAIQISDAFPPKAAYHIATQLKTVLNG